jgi:peroxiredoxin
MLHPYHTPTRQNQIIASNDIAQIKDWVMWNDRNFEDNYDLTLNDYKQIMINIIRESE